MTRPSTISSLSFTEKEPWQMSRYRETPKEKRNLAEAEMPRHRLVHMEALVEEPVDGGQLVGPHHLVPDTLAQKAQLGQVSGNGAMVLFHQ
jgi:hypothetical protein